LRTRLSLTVLIFVVLGTGCTTPLMPTLVPTASPTPVPIVLTVCLPEEPDSLYLYGADSLASQHVWQALYDGPYDSRGYTHQPVILPQLPSLAAGSAAIQVVDAPMGERVLSADGDVVSLAPGIVVRDASGERVTATDAAIPMQQMVVTFTLRSDVYWSDGALLTAEDSVFSFQVAGDPATPGDKVLVERTAEYRSAGNQIVVWRGVPGFLDHHYALNFWHPLPRHVLGHLSASDLLVADAAARQPVGWGPFRMREWLPEDRITVERNPFYYRAAEGLPRVDQVVYRFITDPVTLAQEFAAGRCDIVPHDGAAGILGMLPDQSQLQVITAYDARWDLLAFGVTPAADYDRPDYFEDVRVRQAIAQCIDRSALVDEVLAGAGRVSHGPLPLEHPLYAGGDLTEWAYDPAEGQALLASTGWYDEDGDGVREAHAIPGIADGTPFRVTFLSPGDTVRVQTAQRIQVYLAACGIEASAGMVPSETLFGPGPEGLLFGRRFDLAQFSWRAGPDPLCDLFLSSQLPDAGHWNRVNVAGFLDDGYDTACLSALEAIPDSVDYVAGQREAQRIFSERLPVLPLFQRAKTTLAWPAVVGLIADSTQDSELWNIEQLELR